MAEALTIARPYAEAAFKLAAESNALAAWDETLARLAAVARAPEARDLAGNPRVATATVADAFADVARVEDASQRSFLRTLAENERLAVLPEIAEIYAKLRNAHEGVTDARITSAYALTDAQIADIVDALATKYGRQVKVSSITIDPELIGGVSIAVGDEVTDLSVRGKLARLAGALMN